MVSSSFMLPNTIPEIDARIALLYNEISALQTKRNSLVPFFQLPNEILSQIMFFYARESGVSTFTLRWAKIMHVCRRLHQIVVAEHALWSHIFATDMDTDVYHHIEKQTANAGICSLTVSLTLYYDANLWMWVASGQAARIGSLEISGKAAAVRDLVVAFGDYPWTSLRRLRLKSVGEAGESVEFPDELLDGMLPSLRDLSLSKISVSWNRLRNLDALSLSECPDSDLEADALPNVGHALRLMAASPVLQSFSLIPAKTLEPFDNLATGPISMPSLGYLKFHDSVDAMTVLLKELRLAPTITLKLLPYHVYTGANIRNLIVPLRTHLRHPEAPVRRALDLSIHPQRQQDTGALLYFVCGMTLADSLESCRQYYYSEQDPFTGRIVLNCHPQNGRALRQVVTKFLHAARSELVTHLDTSSVSGLTEPSWRAILVLLPALEVLHLTMLVPKTDTMAIPLHVLRELEKPTPIASLHLRIVSSSIPNFSDAQLEQDTSGEWLLPVVSALSAYIRYRRKAWDSAPAIHAPLALLDIEDERRFLYSAIHKQAMGRIWRRMSGMGIITRDDYEWNPVALRERRRQLWAQMGAHAEMDLAEDTDVDTESDVEEDV
ncbi:F-box domain-containing protein [Mycena chlorophos]|uniref:F-box domain-containing protein n=1 Tax=Mycena chlorophos TaxID=658473 RepID=A0A8H6SDB8_MYCCL|nr:F-box domain-containing protein [Mycena chlorophos]